MKMRNLIKMGWATVNAGVFKKYIPLNVMVSVTNRCQARCSYCQIPHRTQKELSTEQLVQLFDEMKSLGTQRVALWGGEPLLRKDIGYLVDYAKEKCGFFLSLDTNGYLVPQKIGELRNLDVLVISFDGPEEVHDLNKEKGSYRKVIEAFKAVCPEKRVFTITVLTRENVKYIDFILDTAEKYGFYTTFQLLHHTESLASEKEYELIPSNRAYKEAIIHIMRRKKQGAPVVSSMPYLKYILEWHDYKTFTSSRRSILSCWAAKLYCNVDTDGSVYPCSGMVEAMPAKNFLEVGLKTAFDFATAHLACRACVASCFTEYNYMHSFNLEVIWNWLKYTSLKK